MGNSPGRWTNASASRCAAQERAVDDSAAFVDQGNGRSSAGAVQAQTPGFQGAARQSPLKRLPVQGPDRRPGRVQIASQPPEQRRRYLDRHRFNHTSCADPLQTLQKVDLILQRDEI
ncbi:MAG TPA: hypothetical protein G4N94_04860, partial [Caldilineae bacterium]|nr:hypothetical protein [Caldilineae bacterium]